MLLTRAINPWGSWRGALGEMERIRRDMDRVMGTFSQGRDAGAGVYPLLNVTEDKDPFIVTAELPGVDPAGIDISVTGKTLSISGERKPPELPEGARFHRRERGYTTFSRAVSLPSDVDSGKVEASSKNGVLTIHLPKAEAAKPRQISIKSA